MTRDRVRQSAKVGTETPLPVGDRGGAGPPTGVNQQYSNANPPGGSRPGGPPSSVSTVMKDGLPEPRQEPQGQPQGHPHPSPLGRWHNRGWRWDRGRAVESLPETGRRASGRRRVQQGCKYIVPGLKGLSAMQRDRSYTTFLGSLKVRDTSILYAHVACLPESKRRQLWVRSSSPSLSLFLALQGESEAECCHASVLQRPMFPQLLVAHATKPDVT